MYTFQSISRNIQGSCDKQINYRKTNEIKIDSESHENLLDINKTQILQPNKFDLENK